MKKIKVFLTGATGVMGGASLKRFKEKKDKYDVTLFARDSKKNHKKLNEFINEGFKVIWGDLLNKDKLKEGIENCDIVLHVGGLVSPVADKYPKETLITNINSIKNIIEIVEQIEEKNPEKEVKVVYIGSVSQYGPSSQPDHWKSSTDIQRAARHDAYSLSKIIGERLLAESKIKKWVSFRQTAILHKGLLNKTNDPIMFHVPLDGCIEWINVEDSGRLLEKVCNRELRDEFWCKYYNVGGGETYRITNYEFETKLLKALGVPPVERIFEREWFVTDNFHGVWFKDSDELNDILDFRGGKTFDESLETMKNEMSWFLKLAPLAPAYLMKQWMKKVASDKKDGTISWIKNKDVEKIDIYWGGRENYNRIKGWNSYVPKIPEKRVVGITSKSRKDFSVQNVKEIRLKTCDKGHAYRVSPIMERGGHGCLKCLIEDSGMGEYKDLINDILTKEVI